MTKEYAYIRAMILMLNGIISLIASGSHGEIVN
mgnify:CR=1 FL=1